MRPAQQKVRSNQFVNTAMKTAMPFIRKGRAVLGSPGYRGSECCVGKVCSSEFFAQSINASVFAGNGLENDRGLFLNRPGEWANVERNTKREKHHNDDIRHDDIQSEKPDPKKAGSLLVNLSRLFNIVILCFCILPVLMGGIAGCALKSDRWDVDFDGPYVTWSSVEGDESLNILATVSPVQEVVVHFSEPLDKSTLKGENIFIVRGACISESYCSLDSHCGRAFEDEDIACLDSRCHRVYKDDKYLDKLVDNWLEELEWSKNRSPWEAKESDGDNGDGVAAVCSPESQVVWSDLVVGDDNRQVHLRMRKPLAPDALYTLVVTSRVSDQAGNPLFDESTNGGSYKRSFITSNPFASCISLSLLNPAPGLSSVPRNIPGIMLGVDGTLTPGALQAVDLVRGDPYDPFDNTPRACVPEGLWRRNDGAYKNYGVCPSLFGNGEKVSSTENNGTAKTPLNHDCFDGLFQGCYFWPLQELLEPNTKYSLLVDADWIMGPGCIKLEPTLQSFFTTSSVIDVVAPSLTLTYTEMVGGCLAVGIIASEAVALGATLLCEDGGGGSAFWSVSDYKHVHNFSVPVHETCKGHPAWLNITGTDLAGNNTTLEAIELEEYPVTDGVIITEVLANPAGAEPGQEFVEILNVSDKLVNIEGWRFSDKLDSEGDEIPTETLFPGEYGLLVAPNYDPYCGRDPNPHPNALLIYMDSTLGSRGLVNRGSPVYLRDALGNVVSALLESPDMSSSSDNGRSLELSLPKGCGMDVGWEKNPNQSSTPGAPNSGW